VIYVSRVAHGTVGEGKLCSPRRILEGNLLAVVIAVPKEWRVMTMAAILWQGATGGFRLSSLWCVSAQCEKSIVDLFGCGEAQFGRDSKKRRATFDGCNERCWGCFCGDFCRAFRPRIGVVVYSPEWNDDQQLSQAVSRGPRVSGQWAYRRQPNRGRSDMHKGHSFRMVARIAVARQRIELLRK
jgi:hypothetical protein